MSEVGVQHPCKTGRAQGCGVRGCEGERGERRSALTAGVCVSMRVVSQPCIACDDTGCRGMPRFLGPRHEPMSPDEEATRARARAGAPTWYAP